MELTLDDKQRSAVEACLDGSKRLVAVTGPAGTGKTSIMKHVYNALLDAGYSVAGCAPTGKAARRIRDATGIPAKTIHMLLEYTHPGEKDPKTGVPRGYSYPKRQPSNPLAQDVILADEYAMVNQDLNRNLIDGMKHGARLCVFGDINQLPPIESTDKAKSEPSPFKNILTNPAFTGIVLDTIHRQGEGSAIVSNGARILKGFYPQTAPDFKMNITAKIVSALQDHVLESLENGIDYGKLDAQILTPQNKSWIGTHALNQMLQQTIEGNWDPAESWDMPRHDWDSKYPFKCRPGTKVIITANMYEVEYEGVDPDVECGVFNGETGIVLGLGNDGFSMRVDLGDRVAILPPIVTRVRSNGQPYQYMLWKDVYPAYAVTTHKAQGSEFKHVTYVMGQATTFMCNRPNFYTAVTRARQAVTVITDQRGLQVSLATKGTRI